MAFDAHSNFGYSNVAAPAPGLLGTNLVVAPGQGALFPAAPFNCTVWPSGVQPLASNAEIVRVTAVVGDTLTIVRAQEGTGPVDIQTGFQIANTTSRKVFTDIEDAAVIFAGTQAATGPFTFANSNGVTFGMDNGTLTASVDTGGGAGGIAASAGAESISNGTLVFQNGGGITFGLNNSTMTASHDGITSQSNQAFSASGGSSAFQTLVFANSFGITFSNSNGSLVASHNGITQQSTQPVAASASNGSFLFSTLNFSNANGITFGTSAGNIVTASHNGLTSQSAQAASASNGSFTFQTLNFSNANNVTFGTSAGSIIFASVAPPSAASINVSAGATSNNLTNLVFGTGGNITFGLTGSTITASGPSGGGGGNETVFAWQTPPILNGISSIGSTNAVLQMDAFVLPVNLSFSAVRQHGSFSMQMFTTNVSTSHSAGQTRFIAFYSRSVTDSAATNFSNSTAWLLHTSFSAFTQVTHNNSSSSHSWTIQWMTDSTGGLSVSTQTTNQNTAVPVNVNQYQFLNVPYSLLLTKGEYLLMQLTSATGTGAFSNSYLRHSVFGQTINGTLSMRPGFGQTSDDSVLPSLYAGFLATAAIPSSINLTNMIRRLFVNFYAFQG